MSNTPAPAIPSHLTEEFIHRQLDASQDAVEVALCAIYDRQVAEEKLHAFAVQTDGVRFSPNDQEFCTSLVHQIKRGRRLTEKQLYHARRKCKKYWRLLVICMTTELPAAPPVDMPVVAAPALPQAAAQPASYGRGMVDPLEAQNEYASW
jgi:hypothetical protein